MRCTALNLLFEQNLDIFICTSFMKSKWQQCFFLCFCIDVSLCEYNLLHNRKTKSLSQHKYRMIWENSRKLLAVLPLQKYDISCFVSFRFVFITRSIFHISQSNMKCAQHQQQQQQKVNKQANKFSLPSGREVLFKSKRRGFGKNALWAKV